MDDREAMMMESEKGEMMEPPCTAILPSFSNHPFAFPYPGGFFEADEEAKGPLGFLDLLSLHQPSILLDLPAPSTAAAAPPLETSDTVNNLPATLLSISSLSTEPVANPINLIAAGDENSNKSRNGVDGGAKQKKGQKRAMEPRVAFKTRSVVENLADGYRWRKYGQKAVKNSPFPRSYYRCTSARCGVKKRVERSPEDPEVVVTTYEGQHTHPNPVVLHAAAFHPSPHSPLLRCLPPPPHDFRNLAAPSRNLSALSIADPYVAVAGAGDRTHRCNMPAEAANPDHGLLQDLVPSEIRVEEI